MGTLLSDKHRGLKLAILLLLLIGLTLYSALAYRAVPVQWIRAAQWRENFEAHKNEWVWLHMVRAVGRSVDGRTVAVTVGLDRIPLTLLMPRPAPLSWNMDVAGRLIGPGTIRVEDVRFHQSPRSVKVWLSFVAALGAGALFFMAFCFKPGRGFVFRARQELSRHQDGD